MNMRSLSDKVAIVTGAERVAPAIIDSGGEAIAIGADVSKAAEVARLFKEVDTAFGRLDVLVNNAGVFRFGAFADITEESFHVHYNISVLGAILMVQERRSSASVPMAGASSISAPSSAHIRWQGPCSTRRRRGPSKH